jgi:DNA modification methylase
MQRGGQRPEISPPTAAKSELPVTTPFEASYAQKALLGGAFGPAHPGSRGGNNNLAGNSVVVTTSDAAQFEKMQFSEQVERWSLDRLIPHARNARTHSDAQVAQIAGSIAEFGFVNPVLVGDDGVIVAGHGRVLAARKLGLTEAPVIVLSHLTPPQRRALMIADNRIAENAGWDEEMLAAELAALRDDDIDLGLLGFDDAEIDRLLAGTEDQSGDADQAPDPPADPVSRPGDIWICGEHRVLCGDATVLADVELVLGGELADMAFTDPPYNVNYSNSVDKKRRGKNRPILNDALGEGFGELLYDACVNILTVTKGAVYICMSSSELDVLQKAFRAAGGHWSTFVIWAKNTFTLGRSDYQRQYEPILYGWKDGVDHYWCGVRDQGDVWFMDKPTKNDLHPTMKPVELVERAVRNSSKSRDIVLDPFGGSGTTLIAAERAGRRARLIELDPKYVDVVVQRWQNLTGGSATHAATGQTFSGSVS